MTSEMILKNSIGRTYPWPKVTNMTITINSKSHKPTLSKQLKYIIVNTGYLSYFALKRSPMKGINFTSANKQIIFRALVKHPLLVLELTNCRFNDLIYVANGFIEKRFTELRSLSLLNVQPSRNIESTLNAITKGFREAVSAEELKVSMMHKDEVIPLIRVLSELPNVQTITFSFFHFTKTICTVYTNFFLRPKIRKIITKAYKYDSTCMQPFADLFYLPPNLTYVKFNSLQTDSYNELKPIDMEPLFKRYSSLQTLILRNICIKDIEHKGGLMFSKVLKEIKLKNICTTENVSKLLSSVKELPALEVLSMNLMLSSLIAVEALEHCIKMATNLAYLSLEYCGIHDQHFISLRPDRVFRSIKVLKLKGNYLKYESYKQIIEVIRNPLTNIEYIDITDLYIPTNKLYEIFNVIQSHPTLKVFIWNNVYGTSANDNFNLVIKYSGLLEQISIQHVSFSALSIFKALKRNAKLRYISFGISSFNYVEIKKLCKLCEKNNNLELLELNLTQTDFTNHCSFNYFLNELMGRLRPREMRVKLKRLKKEDREYRIKIKIIKKLIFSVSLDMLTFERYIKQWWDSKILHSIVTKCRFIANKLNWAKWIIEHNLNKSLKESLILYLY